MDEKSQLQALERTQLMLPMGFAMSKGLTTTTSGTPGNRAPARFELVINLNTAAALGLAIPQSLLQRAEVIQ